jgi:diguanylate cyclase (GGDEF)-like protein
VRYLQAKEVPAYASAAVAAVSLGAIAGWIFGIEPLMTVLPGMIRMKPNTAVALFFAALALYLAHKRKFRLLQAICACLVGLLGALTLCEYIFGVDAGIDELLFRDPAQILFPGRMAHFTAAALLLSGILLYPFRFRASERLTDLLALTLGFSSTFAIVGYLYGVPILYGSVHYTSMAIHTGIAFLLLSLGFLFIQKPQGFTRIFRAQTPGGLVARSLVPPAILVPIFLGAGFSRFNFGQLKLGIAFVVLCNILLIVAAIWGLARVLDRLELQRGTAQHASEIDGLTGIHNRRYFDQQLATEIQRCVRHSRESCLILFDVDHFKSLNDRFGHQTGDLALISIAQNCAKILRTTDIICRFGGEEFAVIAPETSGKDGMVLADKLRNLVATLTLERAPIPITISLGVAQIGRVAPTSEIAIAAADHALYTAKKLGRNRESLYGDAREVAVVKMVLQPS